MAPTLDTNEKASRDPDNLHGDDDAVDEFDDLDGMKLDPSVQQNRKKAKVLKFVIFIVAFV